MALFDKSEMGLRRKEAGCGQGFLFYFWKDWKKNPLQL